MQVNEIMSNISEEQTRNTCIIHYCWFGRGEKPEVFKKCLDSWKRYMPQYRIIEWNEDNFDVDVNDFTRAAYDAGKYAFVSDVARLWVVHEYGGIYLDTDVELKDSLDYLEQYDSFFFFQSDQDITTGLGFGARKNDKLIGEMFRAYSKISFDANHVSEFLCPKINTASVKEFFQDFRCNNSLQIIDQHIFLPCSEYKRKAEHHSSFSWATENQARALKYAKKKRTHWQFRQKIRSEGVRTFLETHFPKFVVRLYSFLVYDFIDYGMIYWICKAFLKIKSKFWINRVSQ